MCQPLAVGPPVSVDDCIQPRPGAYLSGCEPGSARECHDRTCSPCPGDCLRRARGREAACRRLSDPAGAPDGRLSGRRPDRHSGAAGRGACSPSGSASNSWSRTSRAPAATSRPRRRSIRHPTATPSWSAHRPTPSTPRSTRSSPSISCATPCRSPAWRGCPTRCSCIRRCRRVPSRSSSPTPRPIRARSTWPPRATAPPSIWRARCSRRWPASTSSTSPIAARSRR